MSGSRFEIVHSDAGWHARFRASNGQVVWTTETYTRRRAAVRAVEVIANDHVRGPLAKSGSRSQENSPHTIRWYPVVGWGDRTLEVRDIDERGTR